MKCVFFSSPISKSEKVIVLVGDGGEGARFMRLEANSVEPAVVHFIITRHAYAKSRGRSRGRMEMKLFTFLEVRNLSPVGKIRGQCLASLEAQ